MKQTIEYKGYQIHVAQDEGPENPFESWDCEPPLLTFYGGLHGYFKAYGAPDSMREVIQLLPDEMFSRGKRMDLVKEFILPHFTLRELAQEIKDQGNIRDAFSNLLREEKGSEPHGWRAAGEWFDTVAALLAHAGIECVNTQSNGYSQGDSTLVLAIATLEWLEKSGVQPEHVKESLAGAVELYSAWAWGDVYGVSAIHAPGPDDEDGDPTEGAELDDASCWGFYGADHEKSGLMEHAREVIDAHIEEQAKEASDLLAMVSAE